MGDTTISWMVSNSTSNGTGYTFGSGSNSTWPLGNTTCFMTSTLDLPEYFLQVSPRTLVHLTACRGAARPAGGSGGGMPPGCPQRLPKGRPAPMRAPLPCRVIWRTW